MEINAKLSQSFPSARYDDQLHEIFSWDRSKSYTVLLFITFLNIGHDLVIAYNGSNVSTKAILQQLNITGNFLSVQELNTHAHCHWPD